MSTSNIVQHQSACRDIRLHAARHARRRPGRAGAWAASGACMRVGVCVRGCACIVIVAIVVIVVIVIVIVVIYC